MPSSVRLRGLSRRFAGTDRPAVSRLDLEVESGETVVLVGPSGCGKSTTLRMVAGLDTPDSGAIEIGGRDVRRVAPQDRDVAMVFQGFALYPHMRVRQILEFPLKMRRIGRAERRERAEGAARLLGISHLLERRPGELSGGEQQRVAMGRAIVREPAVFLFDEPLSNLDPALRAELRVELRKLLKRLGATALYVTHDQAEAMTLGDRIAVLRGGELEQLGRPEVIYGAPATAFVASFFGNPPMNLLPVRREADRAFIGDSAIRVPSGSPAELWLGVRPEDLHRADADSAPESGLCVTGTLSAVEPQGADTHWEVEVADALVKTRVPGFRVPEIGRAVSFVIDLGKVHWFDRATGRAL
jgi:multiple sugar transport system ATP-binding protein